MFYFMEVSQRVMFSVLRNVWLCRHGLLPSLCSEVLIAAMVSCDVSYPILAPFLAFIIKKLSSCFSYFSHLLQLSMDLSKQSLLSSFVCPPGCNNRGQVPLVQRVGCTIHWKNPYHLTSDLSNKWINHQSLILMLILNHQSLISLILLLLLPSGSITIYQMLVLSKPIELSS